MCRNFENVIPSTYLFTESAVSCSVLSHTELVTHSGWSIIHDSYSSRSSHLVLRVYAHALTLHSYGDNTASLGKPTAKPHPNPLADRNISWCCIFSSQVSHTPHWDGRTSTKNRVVSLRSNRLPRKITYLFFNALRPRA